MGGSPAPISDLMDGMDRMNADMMAGGTATDIDVAFVLLDDSPPPRRHRHGQGGAGAWR